MNGIRRSCLVGNEDAIQRVIAEIDAMRDDILGTLSTAVQIPSITPKYPGLSYEELVGGETRCNESLRPTYEAAGATIDQWEEEPGRANLVGVVKGCRWWQVTDFQWPYRHRSARRSHHLEMGRSLERADRRWQALWTRLNRHESGCRRPGESRRSATSSRSAPQRRSHHRKRRRRRNDGPRAGCDGDGPAWVPCRRRHRHRADRAPLPFDARALLSRHLLVADHGSRQSHTCPRTREPDLAGWRR